MEAKKNEALNIACHKPWIGGHFVQESSQGVGWDVVTGDRDPQGGHVGSAYFSAINDLRWVWEGTRDSKQSSAPAPLNEVSIWEGPVNGGWMK